VANPSDPVAIIVTFQDRPTGERLNTLKTVNEMEISHVYKMIDGVAGKAPARKVPKIAKYTSFICPKCGSLLRENWLALAADTLTFATVASFTFPPWWRAEIVSGLTTVNADLFFTSFVRRNSLIDES
jgi:hypothetical protein